MKNAVLGVKFELLMIKYSNFAITRNTVENKKLTE